MLALWASIIGLISGIIPAAVKIWELKIKNDHDREILKLRLQALAAGLTRDRDLVDEGTSLRNHDSGIVYTGFWATLRASIRPTITYLFFFLFLAVKIAVLLLMWDKNYDPIALMNAILDDNTFSIFCSVVGFYFGSRAMTKFNTDWSTKRTVFGRKVIEGQDKASLD